MKRKISVEWNTTENLDTIAQSVAQILMKRDYITIFKLGGQNDGNEIDLALLNALLKGIDVALLNSLLKGIDVALLNSLLKGIDVALLNSLLTGIDVALLNSLLKGI